MSDYFAYAVMSLARITDLELKNALCYSLWTTELNQRVSAVMFLIEKMGKCPKERHLEKAIDMDCTLSILMIVFSTWTDFFSFSFFFQQMRKHSASSMRSTGCLSALIWEKGPAM